MKELSLKCKNKPEINFPNNTFSEMRVAPKQMESFKAV